MRGMCRDVSLGPFRAILAASTRPLNSYDWSWMTSGKITPKELILRVPAGEGPLANRSSELRADGTMVFAENNLQVEIADWAKFLSLQVPGLVGVDSLYCES